VTVSLAAAAALGPACTSRQVHSSSPTALRIGFGFGGTALRGALGNLVDSLTAEPLVAINWNGRPTPKLAENWAWSDDALTLRLRLRQGVVFHDGTVLNAGTVVADLRRRLKEAEYGRVKSIDVDEENHIVIRLHEPDAFLLAELFKAGIKTGRDRTLGTGPFVLRARPPAVTFESFDRYHLGPPSISKVVVQTYETPRASWAAMMRGDVDFLYEVNRDAVEFIEAGSRVKTFSFPRPYYVPLVFNIKHPVLGRRDVRQAINEALDRPQIVETALNRRGQPADGPIWPFHWAYNAAARTYTYNPDAARLRLDGAGLPIVEAGGDRMPRRFHFQCLFMADEPQFERIALVVQKQLFEIGIDVKMVPMSILDIQGHLAKGDFDTVLLPMTSGRSLEWTYLFWRSVQAGTSAIVRSGYTAADAALDRLRAARSDDETRIAVADLQRIMYEDPPAAFLVRPETARAVDQSFVVPSEDPGRDIVGSLWQWKPRALAASQRP
jgi:peptide/nickel transport system substrate-binding protein